jgi:hypothetical protein
VTAFFIPSSPIQLNNTIHTPNFSIEEIDKRLLLESNDSMTSIIQPDFIYASSDFDSFRKHDIVMMNLTPVLR